MNNSRRLLLLSLGGALIVVALLMIFAAPRPAPLPPTSATTSRPVASSVPVTTNAKSTSVPVNPTQTPAPIVAATLDTSNLPTVTPLAPGEPTLPPEALAMRAAPTATPSPVMQPTNTPTPTATPTQVPATGSDDVPMVEVPAGEFLMGVTEDTALNFFRSWYARTPAAPIPAPHFSDQTPQLTVNLETFTIDKLEVTNARYRRCVQAGVCTASGYSVIANYPTDPTYDEYPALITWYAANAYCQWVGKRLPTEMEWEKAIRGIDGRAYPWGNEWQADGGNFTNRPQAVGSQLKDQSPFGALDMGGNAREWTSSHYQPYPDNPRQLEGYSQNLRVVRGGDELAPFYPVTTFRRSAQEVSSVGFRCVQGPTPGDIDRHVVQVNVYPTPAPALQVDLSQMAYVPAGEFIMGNDNVGDDPIRQGDRPAHIVYLDTFYIDRHETTAAEFATFLNAIGGHKWRCGLDCIYTQDKSEEPMGLLIKIVNGHYVPGEGRETFPVDIATWEGADAYCRWKGKRLPTEAEWEKAARGTDGRIYPWGNEWDPARLAGGLWTLQSNSTPFTPVGSFPGDVSPYGVFDMAGNVPEWVSDWYAKDYYSHTPYANPTGPEQGTAHVVRGSFGRAARIGITHHTSALGITGFRCVYQP